MLLKCPFRTKWIRAAGLGQYMMQFLYIWCRTDCTSQPGIPIFHIYILWMVPLTKKLFLSWVTLQKMKKKRQEFTVHQYLNSAIHTNQRDVRARSLISFCPESWQSTTTEDSHILLFFTPFVPPQRLAHASAPHRAWNRRWYVTSESRRLSAFPCHPWPVTDDHWVGKSPANCRIRSSSYSEINLKLRCMALRSNKGARGAKWLVATDSNDDDAKCILWVGFPGKASPATITLQSSKCIVRGTVRRTVPRISISEIRCPRHRRRWLCSLESWLFSNLNMESHTCPICKWTHTHTRRSFI